MYQKIMLTHDGSELAASAVPHASTLAQATGAHVVIVQVIDSVARILAQATPATIEPVPAGPLTAELAEESIQSQRRAAEQNLEAVKAQLEREGAKQVSTLIMEGHPGDAIVDAAEEEGCDLIVIATHGRSGLRRVVLGSVADTVVRHAHGAAVLLVRAQQKD